MKVHRFTAASVLAVVMLVTAASAAAAPDITEPFAVIGSGSEPNAVIVDANGTVFTANYLNSSVSKISADGRVNEGGFSGVLAPGAAPYNLALDDAGKLYVVNHVAETVSQLDPVTGIPNAAFAAKLGNSLAGHTPYGITFANGFIYTANNTLNNPLSNSVSVLQKDGAWVKDYKLAPGSNPVGVVVTRAGKAYTANYLGHTVSQIDTVTGAIVDSFANLGPVAQPRAIALDESRNVLWVANYTSNTLSRISIATPTKIDTFTLPSGAQPENIAIDRWGNVYVADYVSGDVSMVLAESPPGPATVIADFTASGAKPFGIAVSPDGNTVYTASDKTNTVSRIRVGAEIRSTPPTDATLGAPLRYQLSAVGLDPIRFRVDGTLPPGVSLNQQTGLLEGTPTAVGTYIFSVFADNPLGSSAPQTITLSVTRNLPKTGVSLYSAAGWSILGFALMVSGAVVFLMRRRAGLSSH